jgi:hypothetical protein
MKIFFHFNIKNNFKINKLESSSLKYGGIFIESGANANASDFT